VAVCLLERCSNQNHGLQINQREVYMENVISKSKFKPHALKYFRQVEKTGKELVITDHGLPKIKIVPYSEDPLESLKSLRNSVITYDDPTEPVGLDEWETLK
jgi:prevent-host-death family protein